LHIEEHSEIIYSSCSRGTSGKIISDFDSLYHDKVLVDLQDQRHSGLFSLGGL